MSEVVSRPDPFPSSDGNAGETSDAVLLERIAAGNSEAWAIFVQRHAARVYAIASRVLKQPHDAEDAVQDVFLRARRYAGTFRYGNDAGGWIGTIAWRTAIKLATRRSKGAQMNIPLDDMDAILADTREGPSTETQSADEQAFLRRAVDRLPDRLRQPIVMHFLGGMNQSAVAAELTCDRSTVIDRIQKGLQILRQELQHAGLAPALALPLAIQNALLSEALPDRLLHRLIELPAGGPAVSPLPSSSSPLVPWLVAGGALVAGGLVVTTLMTRHPAISPTPSVPAPTVAAAPLHAVYDFSKNIPADSEVTYQQGDWRADQSPTRRGLAILGTNRLGLLLPVQLPRAPLYVDARYRMADGEGLVKISLANIDQTPAYDVWNYRLRTSARANSTLHVQTWFWDRFAVQKIDGVCNAVRTYESAWPGERMLIILNNVILERVEISQIETNQIPPDIWDPMKVAAGIARQSAHVSASPLRRLPEAPVH